MSYNDDMGHTHGGTLSVSVGRLDAHDGPYRILVAFRPLTNVPAGHYVAGDYDVHDIDDLIDALQLAKATVLGRVRAPAPALPDADPALFTSPLFGDDPKENGNGKLGDGL